MIKTVNNVGNIWGDMYTVIFWMCTDSALLFVQWTKGLCDMGLWVDNKVTYVGCQVWPTHGHVDVESARDIRHEEIRKWKWAIVMARLTMEGGVW